MSTTTTAFVKAETTMTVEPSRGIRVGGTVYTTVVTNIVTLRSGTRYVETETYVAPDEPRGRYYGQCVGRSWVPVFTG